MNCKRSFLLAALLGISCQVFADVFTVLDKAADGLATGRMSFEAAKAFPAAPMTDAETKCGFRAIAVDLNQYWRNEFVVPAAPRKNLQMLTAAGDYTAEGFSIFMLQDADSVKITLPDLTDGAGHTIKADNLQVMEFGIYGKTPRYANAQMMYEPHLQALKANEQLNFVLFVNVPENTPSGTYTGKLKLAVPGKEAAELSVSLYVMGIRIPAYGNFGFFMYGNLLAPNTKPDNRVVQTGFVPENLKKYFDFYKTRRLNSIALYDIEPDIRLIDGKVKCDFRDISLLAKAMKASNLDGILIIDMRDIGYWCYTVSLKLDTLGGKAPAGDLGVHIYPRKIINKREERYPERAKELYAEAAKLLIEQAKRENWPPIQLLADEELGNRFDESYAFKEVNYESYMPVLQKTCPDISLIIDNTIGYGKVNRVEYGVRDNVKHRCYNSWTEESLALAKRDNADVYSFNYNMSRLNNGLLQNRLGSTGHLQWADLWDSYNFQWQFTRLSDKGVVTSLQVELMHEGVVDYSAARYLEDLIAQKEAAGDKALAAYGKKALTEVLADIPLEHSAAQNHSHMLSNEQHSARRWRIFEAIERLSGQTPAQTVATGKPAVKVIAEEKLPQGGATNFLIPVRLSDEPLKEEVKATEAGWSPAATPFRHLAPCEAHYRALPKVGAANMPSYAVVMLLATEKGLGICATANHIWPKSPYNFAAKDNDVKAMREDDFMRLDFELPNGSRAQLLWNAAGNKCFLRNGKVVPADKITCFTHSPTHEGGGSSFKLFVPWSMFQTKCPRPGTVWRFNASRRIAAIYDAIREYRSWVPMARSLEESNKWGRLVFLKPGEPVPEVKYPAFITVTPAVPCAVSGNEFVVHVEAHHGSPAADMKLKCTLKHESGQTVELPVQTVKDGGMNYCIQTNGLKPGRWQVQFALEGRAALPEDKVEMELLSSPWQK